MAIKAVLFHNSVLESDAGTISFYKKEEEPREWPFLD
jgi:hypothetical protein